MNVLLLQLDGGGFPNIALMRLSAHHKALGDSVEFRKTDHVSRIPRNFGDSFQRVYASAIFAKSMPLAEAVWEQWPGALVGGTGIDPPPGKNTVNLHRDYTGAWSFSPESSSLEQTGVTTLDQDYSTYPNYQHSIGFSQRGCRLKCDFCVVPRKEGKVRSERTIAEIWRGDPYPRNIVLLDNDFFGQAAWRGRIREIQDGGFKVSFNQGINARCLTDEAAEAIASIHYSDDDFTTRRIYTAWDSRGDEARLFKGLNALVRYGVKPDHIMVYMLCGFWPGETHEDRDYRRMKLREFGARPYPMPFVRTRELIGFQRWVVGAYDKRVAWSDWIGATYEPRKLGATFPLFEKTQLSDKLSEAI